MALVLENGTGLSTANSYVSVAEADTYHTLYGNLDWSMPADDASPEDEAALLAQKELALIQASRSIDLLFGARYSSYTAYPAVQAMLFPRASFYINNWQLVTGVPRLLKDAVCEIAVLALNGEDILPNLNAEASIKSSSFSLGPISETVTYGSVSTLELFTGFYKIELLLAPLLISVQPEMATHFAL